MQRIFFLLGISIMLMSFTGIQKLTPINASGSSLKFTISGPLGEVAGSVKGIKGEVVYNSSDLANSKVNVSAQVNTIKTGIDMRDGHLQKPEFFDGAKYPTMSFQSVRFFSTSAGVAVTGNFTLKNVTKSINVPIKASTVSGKQVFTGTFKINRQDYGLSDKTPGVGNTATITFVIKE